MRLTFKFALCLLVALLPALVHLPTVQSRDARSPYASSLGTFGGDQIYAAVGCSFRTCLFRGERQFCESTTLANKCAQKGTNCTSSSC